MAAPPAPSGDSARRSRCPGEGPVLNSAFRMSLIWLIESCLSPFRACNSFKRLLMPGITQDRARGLVIPPPLPS